MAKVALAYSGGLDTTICLHYLRNVRGLKVITFSANLGQPEYLEPLAEMAVDLGATAAHLADLREKFAREFIWPTVRAEAVYERNYYLFSALARPLIMQDLVAIAQEEGCDYIAHGSRGIGNDRIRLANSQRALAPDLRVLAPLEDLGLRNPADDVAYAKAHGLRIENVRQTLYNVEQNLWGSNIQVPSLRDTWEEPPRDTYFMTVPPAEAPSRPMTLTVAFESGLPTGVDGEAMPPVRLIETLNKLGGRHAVGRVDFVENRISGRKTREIYEAPAAQILHTAHRALEAITLPKDVIHFKDGLSRRYADLVYEGQWFAPVREGLDAFFEKVTRPVTGEVRMTLGRGMLTVTGRRSPHSLYEPPTA